ncbi:MAG: hypothetical protein OHK0012_11170 [Synechococcales cyanobacterium]
MEPMQRLHPEHLPDSVRMLVLFGSRASGKTHAQSDWDIGYLGNPITSWEDLALYGQVADALGIPADRLDLVDLQRCSPLLGYGVARDGKLIFEAEPGLFRQFQSRAWRIYADTEKFRVLQKQCLDDRLKRLGIL